MHKKLISLIALITLLTVQAAPAALAQSATPPTTTASAAPPTAGGSFSGSPAAAAQRASGAPVNLDLSSTHRTMSGGTPSGAAVPISVGGATLPVSSTTLLTPAQYLAVQQILTTGRQSLTIGDSGQAIGGKAFLGSALSALGNLVIPKNVSVINTSGSLNLAGSLVDAGALYITSLTPGAHTVQVDANNMFVQSTGTLTNILPTGLLSGLPAGPMNLVLNAVNDFVNNGVVSSSGNLNITAGSGSITNTNLISALGSVTLAGAADKALNVNNSGGTIRALNGAINVREADFAGAANSYVSGGNLLSRQLNVNAGGGTAWVDVSELTGAVNATGYGAHVFAATDVLNLGNIDVLDPTFYNSAGNINLTGNITVAEPIAIVASGDITNTGNVAVALTSSGSGVNGNIALVAGALIDTTNCVGCTNTSTASGSVGNVLAGKTITVIGASATGGSINLSNMTTNFSISSASGSQVDLMAFKGTNVGANTGAIVLPSNATISVGGTGGVNVIAGGVNGAVTGKNAIELGRTITSGGPITVSTSQPSVGGGVTFSETGAATGTFSTGTTTAGTASVLLQSNAGQPLVITSGKTASDNLNVTASGPITFSSNTRVTVDTGAAQSSLTTPGAVNITTPLLQGVGSGSVTTFTTNGTGYNITSTGTTFTAGSASGAATFNLNGAPVVATATNETINASTTFASDKKITFNANTGTFTNNGTVQSSLPGGSGNAVVVQSSGGLTIAGSGSIAVGAATNNAAFIVPALSNLIITNGTSQAVSDGSLALTADSINVTGAGSTGTLTSTAQAVTWQPAGSNDMTLSGGAGAQLNLNSNAPFVVNAAKNFQVNGVTLQVNKALTVNVPNGFTFQNSGTIRSTLGAGSGTTISVVGAGDLSVTGAGTITTGASTNKAQISVPAGKTLTLTGTSSQTVSDGDFTIVADTLATNSTSVSLNATAGALVWQPNAGSTTQTVTSNPSNIIALNSGSPSFSFSPTNFSVVNGADLRFNKPVTFTLNGGTFTNVGTVRAAGSGTTITIASTGDLALANTGSLVVGGAANTAAITIPTGKILTLNAGANQTVTDGNVAITADTIRGAGATGASQSIASTNGAIGWASAGASNLTLTVNTAGNIVALNGNFSTTTTDFTVATGANLSLNKASTFTVNGTFTNGGTITTNSNNITVQSTGANNLTLAGTGTIALGNAANTANFNVPAGQILRLQNGVNQSVTTGKTAISADAVSILGATQTLSSTDTITLTPASGAAAALSISGTAGNVLNLNSSAGVTTNSGSLTVGSLSLSSTGPITMNATGSGVTNTGVVTAAGVLTANLGSGGTFTNNGTFRSNSATATSILISPTSGSMTVSGTGTLNVNGAGNTARISVPAGQTLTFTNAVQSLSPGSLSVIADNISSTASSFTASVGISVAQNSTNNLTFSGTGLGLTSPSNAIGNSSSGNITIPSGFTLGTTGAATNVTLATSKTLTNSGTLSNTGAIGVTSGGALTLDGNGQYTTTANGNLTFTAPTSITLGGATAFAPTTSTGTGSVNFVTPVLNVGAAGSANLTATSGSAINVTTTGNNLTVNTLSAGKTLTLNGAPVNINSSGAALNVNFGVNGTPLTLNTNGGLTVNGANIILGADGVLNNSGGGFVHVQGNGPNNSLNVALGNNATISSGGIVGFNPTTAGSIQITTTPSGSPTAINAGTFANFNITDAGAQAPGTLGPVNVTVGSITGTIRAAGNPINITASNAGGGINIGAITTNGGNFVFVTGTPTTQGNITLTGLINTSSTTGDSGNVYLVSMGTVGNIGFTGSGGDITTSNTNGFNGGQVFASSSNGSITLKAIDTSSNTANGGDVILTSGAASAGCPTCITTNSINTSAGTLAGVNGQIYVITQAGVAPSLGTTTQNVAGVAKSAPVIATAARSALTSGSTVTFRADNFPTSGIAGTVTGFSPGGFTNVSDSGGAFLLTLNSDQTNYSNPRLIIPIVAAPSVGTDGFNLSLGSSINVTSTRGATAFFGSTGVTAGVTGTPINLTATPTTTLVDAIASNGGAVTLANGSSRPIAIGTVISNGNVFIQNNANVTLGSKSTVSAAGSATFNLSNGATFTNNGVVESISATTVQAVDGTVLTVVGSPTYNFYSSAAVNTLTFNSTGSLVFSTGGAASSTTNTTIGTNINITTPSITVGAATDPTTSTITLNALRSNVAGGQIAISTAGTLSILAGPGGGTCTGCTLRLNSDAVSNPATTTSTSLTVGPVAFNAQNSLLLNVNGGTLSNSGTISSTASTLQVLSSGNLTLGASTGSLTSSAGTSITTTGAASTLTLANGGRQNISSTSGTSVIQTPQIIVGTASDTGAVVFDFGTTTSGANLQWQGNGGTGNITLSKGTSTTSANLRMGTGGTRNIFASTTGTMTVDPSTALTNNSTSTGTLTLNINSGTLANNGTIAAGATSTTAQSTGSITIGGSGTFTGTTTFKAATGSGLNFGSSTLPVALNTDGLTVQADTVSAATSGATATVTSTAGISVVPNGGSVLTIAGSNKTLALNTATGLSTTSPSLTIFSTTTLASNNGVVANVNGGTFTNNGTLSSTASTVQVKSTTGLTVAGVGSIATGGNAFPVTVSPTGANTLIIAAGANQAVSGGALNITADTIQQNGAAGSQGILSASQGINLAPLSVTTLTLTAQNATNKLTLNGGPVSSTSTSLSITNGLALESNRTITLNVNGGTFTNSGAVNSTQAAGSGNTINIVSTGDLTIAGGAGTAANGGYNAGAANNTVRIAVPTTNTLKFSGSNQTVATGILSLVADNLQAAAATSTIGAATVTVAPTALPTLSFTAAAAGNILNLNGAVTTTSTNATIGSGAILANNSTLTMNVNGGTFTNNGNIRNSVAATAVTAITVQSSGALTVDGVGTITTSSSGTTNSALLKTGTGAADILGLTGASSQTTTNGNLIITTDTIRGLGSAVQTETLGATGTVTLNSASGNGVFVDVTTSGNTVALNGASVNSTGLNAFSVLAGTKLTSNGVFNIGLASAPFTNNGSISSTLGAGSGNTINITSSGALTVAGSGTLSTGAANNTARFASGSGSTITLSNTTQSVTDGLALLQAATITGSGTPVISSPSGISIQQSGGTQLAFNGTTTFNGSNVGITATNMTVNSGAVVQTNKALTATLASGGTMTNSGTLRSTAGGGALTVQSTAGNLTVLGSGTYDTSANNGNVVFSAPASTASQITFGNASTAFAGAINAGTGSVLVQTPNVVADSTVANPAFNLTTGAKVAFTPAVGTALAFKSAAGVAQIDVIGAPVSATSGTISLAAKLNAGAQPVTLDISGKDVGAVSAINQTVGSGITASTLTVNMHDTVPADTVTASLVGTNAIGTFVATGDVSGSNKSINNIVLNDGTTALTVGALTNINNLTVTGADSIGTSAGSTLTGALSLTATNAVAVSNAFTAKGMTFSGSTVAVNAGLTSTGPVNITGTTTAAGTGISIAAPISASSQAVSLTVSGKDNGAATVVMQSGTGTITAGTLTANLNGVGTSDTATLNLPLTNNVGTLSVIGAGSAPNIATNNVSIDNGTNALALGSMVNVNNLTVVNSGDLSTSASSTIRNVLSLTSSGTISINNATTADGGATLTSTKTAAGTDISLGAALSAPGQTITLNVSGKNNGAINAINQTAGGITAGTLNVNFHNTTPADTVTANLAATNAVGTVNATGDISGSNKSINNLTLNNGSTNLTVGTLTRVNNFNVTSAGTIGTTSDTTLTGTLGLTGSGAVTLSNAFAVNGATISGSTVAVSKTLTSTGDVSVTATSTAPGTSLSLNGGAISASGKSVTLAVSGRDNGTNRVIEEGTGAITANQLTVNFNGTTAGTATANLTATNAVGNFSAVGASSTPTNNIVLNDGSTALTIGSLVNISGMQVTNSGSVSTSANSTISGLLDLTATGPVSIGNTIGANGANISGSTISIGGTLNSTTAAVSLTSTSTAAGTAVNLSGGTVNAAGQTVTINVSGHDGGAGAATINENGTGKITANSLVINSHDTTTTDTVTANLNGPNAVGAVSFVGDLIGANRASNDLVLNNGTTALALNAQTNVRNFTVSNAGAITTNLGSTLSGLLDLTSSSTITLSQPMVAGNGANLTSTSTSAGSAITISSSLNASGKTVNLTVSGHDAAGLPVINENGTGSITAQNVNVTLNDTNPADTASVAFNGSNNIRNVSGTAAAAAGPVVANNNFNLNNGGNAVTLGTFTNFLGLGVSNASTIDTSGGSSLRGVLALFGSGAVTLNNPISAQGGGTVQGSTVTINSSLTANSALTVTSTSTAAGTGISIPAGGSIVATGTTVTLEVSGHDGASAVIDAPGTVTAGTLNVRMHDTTSGDIATASLTGTNAVGILQGSGDLGGGGTVANNNIVLNNGTTPLTLGSLVRFNNLTVSDSGSITTAAANTFAGNLILSASDTINIANNTIANLGATLSSARTAPGTAITLGASLSSPGQSVTLNVNGADNGAIPLINQTGGGVTASTLNVNFHGTGAADTASANLTSANAVGTINAVGDTSSGVNARNNVTLNNGTTSLSVGTLTRVNNFAVTAAGAITTTSDATLGGTLNLTGDTVAVSKSFTAGGAVNVRSTSTAAGTGISLNGGALNAPGQTVTLDVAGHDNGSAHVIEEGTGTITAGSLLVNLRDVNTADTSTANLTNANAVGNFSAVGFGVSPNVATNNIVLNNGTTALTLGSLVNINDFTVTNAGSIGTSAGSTLSGTLDLTASGAVNLNHALSADGVDVSGSAVTITSTLTSSDTVDITSTQTGAGTAITVTGAISAAGQAVNLTVSGHDNGGSPVIDEVGVGSITAQTLNVNLNDVNSADTSTVRLNGVNAVGTINAFGAGTSPNIATNNVTLNNGSTDVNVGQLVNINNFNVSGGNVSTTTDTTISGAYTVVGSGAVTVGNKISADGVNLTGSTVGVSKTVTSTDDVAITSTTTAAGTAIALNSDIHAVGHTVSLDVSGKDAGAVRTITQGAAGSIEASEVSLNFHGTNPADTATADLTGSNNIGTINGSGDISGANVAFNDIKLNNGTNPLQLGTLVRVHGLEVTNAGDITTSQAATLSGDLNLNTSGKVTIDDSLQTANATISSTQGGAGTAIQLNAPLSGSTVTFNVAGHDDIGAPVIAESATGAVNAGVLNVNLADTTPGDTATVALGAGSNNVGTLNAIGDSTPLGFATNNVALNNGTNNLTLGSLINVNNLNATAGSIGTTSDTTLGGSLTLTGSGTVTLSNKFTVAGASITGNTVVLTDVLTSSDDVSLTATTTGVGSAISIFTNIFAGGSSVTLDVSGSDGLFAPVIDESGFGTITADALTVNFHGTTVGNTATANLNGTNAIGTFNGYGDASGTDVAFNNVSLNNGTTALTIGDLVNVHGFQVTAAGSISTSSNATLTGALSLTSSGPISLSNQYSADGVTLSGSTVSISNVLTSTDDVSVTATTTGAGTAILLTGGTINAGANLVTLDVSGSDDAGTGALVIDEGGTGKITAGTLSVNFHGTNPLNTASANLTGTNAVGTFNGYGDANGTDVAFNNVVLNNGTTDLTLGDLINVHGFEVSSAGSIDSSNDATITGGLSLTGSGPVTLSNKFSADGVTVSGSTVSISDTLTSTDNVSITSTSSGAGTAISLSAAIIAAGNDVTLDISGHDGIGAPAITQNGTGSITANSLTVNLHGTTAADTATVNLNGANAVGTLNAVGDGTAPNVATNNVYLDNGVTPLTLGQIVNINNLNVANAGNITTNADAVLTGLLTLTSSGSVTLSKNYEVNGADITGLILAINSTLTSHDDVTLTSATTGAGTAISLAGGAINAAGKSVTLDVSGHDGIGAPTISEGGTGTITANGLTINFNDINPADTATASLTGTNAISHIDAIGAGVAPIIATNNITLDNGTTAIEIGQLVNINDFNLLHAGNVTTSTDNTISGIASITSSGTVTFDNTLTATNITATGTAIGGTGLLTAGTLVDLTATQGDLGSPTAYMNVSAPNLNVSASNIVGGVNTGSIYINGFGNTTLGTVSMGAQGTFDLENDGTVTVSSTAGFTGNDVTIHSTTADVILNAAVTGTTTLDISGTRITGTGSANGGQVSLTATSGNISSDGGTGYFNTVTNDLIVSATNGVAPNDTGSAYISNTGTIDLDDVSVGNNGVLDLKNTGNITVNAGKNITADTVKLNSTAGNTIVNATITTDTVASITGQSILGTGLVVGPEVDLSSTQGDIGSPVTNPDTYFHISTPNPHISAHNVVGGVDTGSAYVINTPAFDIDLDDVSVGAQGTLDLTNQGSITVNNPFNADNIKLTTTDSTSHIDVNANLTGTTLVSLTTSFLDMNGTSPTSPVIKADVISIQSPGLLTVSGQGNFQSDSITNFLTTATTGGGVTFANGGNFNFNGPVHVVANGTGSTVTVGTTAGSGTVLTGDDALTFYTANVVNNGTITANPFTVISATGQATMSAVGDLIVPKGMNFVGKDLAMVATRNIIAASNLTTINLSNPKGDGGSLTIVAGYDFSNPVPGTVTIGSPSPTGGSVNMPKVSINTSTTFNGGNAGSVTIIATAGTEAAGVISVGAIKTTALTKTFTGAPGKANIGGAVTLIGQGGVFTKSINTSGAIGGNVLIAGSAPTIPTGPGSVQIVNSFVSPGVFGAARTSDSNNAAVNVVGAITTTGMNGHGGNVRIVADKQISVTGAIKTSGLSVPNPLVAKASGNVEIKSGFFTGLTFNPTSLVTVGGAITTSGLRLMKSANQAGNAGNINIVGGALSTKALTAVGGANGGTGNGGRGGDITLTTGTIDVAGTPWYSGTISVAGAINAAGGAASTKLAVSGGRAGDVDIDGASLKVTGSTGGASILASGGKATTVGSGGSVNINTYALQPLTLNFDLTSTMANIPVLPGGYFTVMKGAAVNGLSGKIVSNGDTVTNRTSIDGDPINVGSIHVLVTGSNQTISGPTTQPVIVDIATGKRGMVTPASAVALMQVSQTQLPASQTIKLLANGAVDNTQPSTVTLNQSQVDGFNFTAFKLPSNVTLTVNGPTPALNLPTALNIAGDINFPSATTAYINTNGAALTLPQGASISTTGDLMLSGTGAKWTNNGTITADNLIVARPSSAAFNFITNATGALNVLAIQLSPSVDAGLNMTFTNNGSAAGNSPVNFGAIPTPGLFKPNAIANAASANASRNVTLSFNLKDQTGAAQTGTIGGTLGGVFGYTIGTVTFKGIGNTALNFGTNANINSTKNIAVTATGQVAFNNDVKMTAATNIAITSATKIDLADRVAFNAGTLASTYVPGTLVGTKQVTKAGSISLTSNGVGGIEIGDTAVMNSGGGNINIVALTKVKNTVGNVVLGKDGKFAATGGNISVRANGTVSGDINNEFTAIGKTTKSNFGGVEIASGVKTSGLNAAFAKKAGTIPANFGILGTGTINRSGQATGVILPTVAGAGSLNIATGASTATLTLTKGVIVFNANAAGSSIQFPGLKITTISSKPTAADAQRESQPDEFVVDTADDGDASELMVVIP